VEVIKIPDHDRIQILQEHRPEHFEVPPGKSDKYTSIEILMFPGRSLDTKRRLYETMVRNPGTLSIEPLDIMVILLEPPLENWGVVGKAAFDIDLGFKIDLYM